MLAASLLHGVNDIRGDKSAGAVGSLHHYNMTYKKRQNVMYNMISIKDKLYEI